MGYLHMNTEDKKTMRNPLIAMIDESSENKYARATGHMALGEDGQVVTSGGRVLCVTGVGATVSEAQANAYVGVKQITWRNAQYRTDIGYRAVAREKA